MARCGQVAAFLALPCPPVKAAFCQRPMQTSLSALHQARWAYFGSNGSSAQCHRRGRQPGLSCSGQLPWRMTSASRHVWHWIGGCGIRSGISRCDQIQNPVLALRHRIVIILMGMACTKQSQHQKVFLDASVCLECSLSHILGAACEGFDQCPRSLGQLLNLHVCMLPTKGNRLGARLQITTLFTLIRIIHHERSGPL